MSAQWCLDECFECGRVLDGPTNFCSPQCEAAARPPSPDCSDDTDDDADYSSWHRVAQWAHAVHPSPPPSPPVFASPSKRILTPQHPTAALTSNNPVPARAHASPPRPARTPRTAAESLQASSTASPSPISLGGFVRSWAHRPQLPRLTTANFAVFAKTHPPAPPPLPSDETTTSDGDVSPVWWLAAEPDSSASSPASRLVVHRRAPAPRGRKAVRA